MAIFGAVLGAIGHFMYQGPKEPRETGREPTGDDPTRPAP
jgi:hypothetical protein